MVLRSGDKPLKRLQPKSILLSGCVLAFCIAVVNAGFVLLTGTSVSHMTGDVSRLALNLTGENRDMTITSFRVGIASLGFILGAITSGLIVHHPQVEISRPYGRMVIAVGVLLLLAHAWLPVIPTLAIGIGALACGMQNALATRYHGIILRTTHLTGLFTELGVAIGMRLRGYPVPHGSIWVPAGLSLAFFLGALTGGSILYFSSCPLLAVMGIVYILAGTAWGCRAHGILPAIRQTPKK
jgi:uncharacterized membrane protein YoaK (UPF0700 family)